MEVSATPAPVVATGYIPKNWSEEITLTQILVISLLPVVSLLLIYVLLRIVWKVPGSHGLPKYSQPSYGAIPSGESSLSHIDRPKSSLVEEGEVAGDYEESWLRTFDFVFLVGMMIYLAVLFILTFIYQPWLLTSSRFWLLQLPKLGVMMLVSLLGGIVCRFFCDGALTFIIVFITGIGDGLAEPVGIAWGKHKYKTRGCFSKNKYTRSWEGSACVFLSGMIFPALQYADFANFTQVLLAMLVLAPTMAYAEATAPHTMDTPVLLAMLVLAPTMAYAEATAPHTMDTPVLMIGCGLILYIITHYF
ncbi:hypothetical protein P43SY_007990 [Pythium insidiosum]|uniref:Dolichol kinase n=1 Tax=Pythium insidiosum TaxID=114742 RepID=A0AAD5M9P7_PYTIN|nr:hypothetical protein P43SY_007990 [Pythium insidiosum]